MHVDQSDADRGIYGKFDVRRTDGRCAPGEKHHGCRYFVLDLTHDPHAPAALRAYADSCAGDYPVLAGDLRYAADQIDADRKFHGEVTDADVGFSEGTWERRSPEEGA